MREGKEQRDAGTAGKPNGEKKRLFKRFLKCSVRGGDAEEGGEEAVRR